jgi:hypothetical protein
MAPNQGAVLVALGAVLFLSFIGSLYVWFAPSPKDDEGPKTKTR